MITPSSSTTTQLKKTKKKTATTKTMNDGTIITKESTTTTPTTILNEREEIITSSSSTTTTTTASTTTTVISTAWTVVVGVMLLTLTTVVFYIDGHGLMANANSNKYNSKVVTAFYCAVMTLTTVGFGDVCPGEHPDTVGTIFLTLLPLIGLGFFCGPILSLASMWKHQLPTTTFTTNIIPLIVITLTFGTSMLMLFEDDMSIVDAIHLSIITATTIGYGNSTPKTDMGRIGLSLYAILAINVMGGILEISKDVLLSFCRRQQQSPPPPPPPSTASKISKVEMDQKKDD